MRVGVPRETKVHEYRVGLVPNSVRELVEHGHSVIVERGAGIGSGLSDEEYQAAGAEMADGPEPAFAADLIVKVKEPQPNERKRLKLGPVLFTYLHLAPDYAQTEDLVRSGATCIAYETVTGPSRSLPLLTPMSEVAGRLSVQVGAHYLEKVPGGRGILLGGVPGVLPAEVVILGAGVSGSNTAAVALGMGATVTILDRSADALRRIADRFDGFVRTVASGGNAIAELVRHADLLIGAVLIPGAAAPKLVTHDMVRSMNPGSVIVDIAINQGKCIETAHATTHSQPIYVVDGVVHYCVTNMPGAVPRTSSFALNSVILPFALALADKGWKRALQDDPDLRQGLNVHAGKVFCAPVAAAHGLDATPIQNALAV